VGVTSKPQTATLTNNTGAAIASLAITASGEYAESDNCGTTLANGASCILNVTVTPATADRPSPCWRKKATAMR
jgi:hypothetical protein